MENFTCKAHVDRYIESLDPATITEGPIGQWGSDGTVINIVGKVITKSKYFVGSEAVRWRTEGHGKSFFDMGLACYLQGKTFSLLKIVK